ncbi:hypothetical protein CIL02_01600 [Prevotella sp. P3-122]|nr:hypothetical protein CIL02_01600 [Prevotella sp. P3-122]
MPFLQPATLGSAGVATVIFVRQIVQCFALADAMLCVGRCKALRWRMQSFAMAHAMLCVSGCNALRLKMAKLAEKPYILLG